MQLKEGRSTWRALTRDEVLQIREYRRLGHTYRDIAEAFMVSNATVTGVLTGRTHQRYRLRRLERVHVPPLEVMAERRHWAHMAVSYPDVFADALETKRARLEALRGKIDGLEAIKGRTYWQRRALRGAIEDYEASEKELAELEALCAC